MWTLLSLFQKNTILAKILKKSLTGSFFVAVFHCFVVGKFEE